MSCVASARDNRLRSLVREAAMKAPKAPNALYAQSGGPSAVINASAAGVIEAVRKARGKIGTLYAGRNGIVGILTEELIDTGKESASAVAKLRLRPRQRVRNLPLQAPGFRA
jgi:hypothetical protein